MYRTEKNQPPSVFPLVNEAEKGSGNPLDGQRKSNYDVQKEVDLNGREEASNIRGVYGKDVRSETQGVDRRGMGAHQKTDSRNDSQREAAEWARGYVTERSLNEAANTAKNQARQSAAVERTTGPPERYSIGQIQERSISQINGSSTTNSGAQRGNASSATVAHFTIPVEEKFSVEELPVSGQKILDA